MSSLSNHVQLVGNVGNDVEVKQLETGKKMVRFSLATNEHYTDAKGEKQTETSWHNLVAWNKNAEIVEKYVTKGKQIAIWGKLKSRSYTTDDGAKKYITEVVVNEVLLLGGK